MAFTTDRRLKIKKDTDIKDRKRVGYKKVKGQVSYRFCLENHSFTNPISGTVFAYLNDTLTEDVAILAVEQMEKQLDTIGAMESMLELNFLDVLSAVIPIGKYIQAADKCMGAAGGVFIKHQVSSDVGMSQWNPYEPKTGTTWTLGTMADRYVEYALSFWKKHRIGPAYRLQSDPSSPYSRK